MISYRELLEEFLRDEQNRKCSAAILNKLTGQYVHGFIAETRRRGFDSFINESWRIINYLVKDALENRRYTASILPTIISPQQARNFWFKDEKGPSVEEIYRFLYIILTGVYKGNFVVNLDNINFSAMNDFRRWLLDRKAFILPEERPVGGLDTRRVMGELGIRSFPISEFGFTLLLASYFSNWLKDKIGEEEWREKWSKLGLPSTLSSIGVEDTATLIVINLHRQKKEMHIFPRFKEFVVKWFGDFICGKRENIDLILFLSSIYTRHKGYRELIEKTMDKFIYYLLRGYVSGELLDNMVNLKIKYELKERKNVYYPIQRVRGFLKTLA